MSEQGRNDEQLEGFLQRRSDVNRAYRHAANEQPPRSLDAAILDAARRAVAPRRRPWAMRWGPPLAAAAVLALAVAVTVQLRDQTDLAAEAPKPAPEARPQAEPPPPERRQAEADSHEQRQDTRQRQARSELMRDDGAEAPARSSAQAERSKVEQAPRGNAALGGPPRPAQSKIEQEPRSAQHADREDTVAAAREAAPPSEPQPLAKSRKEDALRTSPAPQPAEAALARIRQHYTRGEMEQADHALRQFCLDFPGYSVPKDLATHAARLAPACRNAAGQ